MVRPSSARRNVVSTTPARTESCCIVHPRCSRSSRIATPTRRSILLRAITTALCASRACHTSCTSVFQDVTGKSASSTSLLDEEFLCALHDHRTFLSLYDDYSSFRALRG